MRLAIEVTREGIEKGQTPFGAVIVKEGEVIASSHNQVWMDTDITAHAEINTIRAACRTLNTIDLSGAAIYSTCEPCPMCFSASHWARLERIVYGATIEDAAHAGFHELSIHNHLMKEIGGSEIAITAGILREECAALFDLWNLRADKRTY
jgi:tRNA(Arg) A34 adenosine deaminase TadA